MERREEEGTNRTEFWKLDTIEKNEKGQLLKKRRIKEQKRREGEGPT